MFVGALCPQRATTNKLDIGKWVVFFLNGLSNHGSSSAVHASLAHIQANYNLQVHHWAHLKLLDLCRYPPGSEEVLTISGVDDGID